MYFIKLINSIKRNFVFFISVAGALTLHLVLAWQPLERLEGFRLITSTGPLMDDSYIFFKISKDIADWFAGCSSSFQLTSGFQPLIAFLYCPFFLFFGGYKELPIHLALSLNAVLGFIANILLYRLLRNIVSRPIATFLVSVWIWSPYVMYQSINGMETTLALLLILIAVSYYWRIIQLSSHGIRPWFLLGIIIGIGFWARVDIGMLGFAIVLDQMWLALRGNHHSFPLRVRNSVLCSLTALFVASPWIVFTVVDTGAILPISGRAVHQVTTVLFDFRHPKHMSFLSLMYMYFKKELFAYQPLVALFNHQKWSLFITSLSLIGCLLSLKDKKLCTLFRPVWIFQATIVISYLVFIGGFWHLNRYLYPVFTLMLIVHAATLGYLQSLFSGKSRIVNLILLVLFVPYIISYTSQYQSQWSQNRPSRYLSSSLFTKEHIPKNKKVGTFQSGCLSYWLDNQVVNLDGVINRMAYFHLKKKTMNTYLEEQKIDFLVEEVFLFDMWDEYLGGQLSQMYDMVILKRANRLRRANSRLGIYKRNPKRMIETP